VDIREQERLLASQKDRAENLMIVDLMRNDLASVCEDDSICVTQLCQLESYQSVLHLVSAVEGQLKSESSLCDLLAAIFPGGSITGAPKVRAMEIISELEPTSRGAYCGSVGYLGCCRPWLSEAVGFKLVADVVKTCECYTAITV